MTYRAKMHKGKVVFEGGIKPADGVRLRVAVLKESANKVKRRGKRGTTLGERMMKFAGVVSDLPPDASRNHDHYLYGTPRR